MQPLEVVPSKDARNDLLSWLNAKLIETQAGNGSVPSFQKVEHCGSGVPYALLLPTVLSTAPYQPATYTNKVKVPAKHSFDAVSNMKLVQEVLHKHGVPRPDVLQHDLDKLIQGNFQANLVMLQWFKGLCAAAEARGPVSGRMGGGGSTGRGGEQRPASPAVEATQTWLGGDALVAVHQQRAVRAKTPNPASPPPSVRTANSVPRSAEPEKRTTTPRPSLSSRKQAGTAPPAVTPGARQAQPQSSGRKAGLRTSSQTRPGASATAGGGTPKKVSRSGSTASLTANSQSMKHPLRSASSTVGKEKASGKSRAGAEGRRADRAESAAASSRPCIFVSSAARPSSATATHTTASSPTGPPRSGASDGTVGSRKISFQETTGSREAIPDAVSVSAGETEEQLRLDRQFFYDKLRVIEHLVERSSAGQGGASDGVLARAIKEVLYATH